MEGEDGGGRCDDGLDESQASYGKDQLGYNNTEEEDRDQDAQSMADGEGYTGRKVCAVAPHHSSGPVVVSTAVPAPPSVGLFSNATPVPYSLDSSGQVHRDSNGILLGLGHPDSFASIALWHQVLCLPQRSWIEGDQSISTRIQGRFRLPVQDMAEETSFGCHISSVQLESMHCD